MAEREQFRCLSAANLQKVCEISRGNPNIFRKLIAICRKK
jgi:hypothetical protein